MIRDVVPIVRSVQDEDARKINEAHRRYVAKSEEAHQEAKGIAEVLVAKKEQLGHGQWNPWVRTNLDFSVRRAQQYMSLLRPNAKSFSHLPLDALDEQPPK
jgi:hypothetical protein